MEKLKDTKINIHRSLTWGIRSFVYSYLPLKDLIRTISKLSKRERSLLTNRELVDQHKDLLIKNKGDKNYNYS